MGNRNTKIDSSQISPIKPEDVSGQNLPQSGQVLSYDGNDDHFKWANALLDDKYLIDGSNTCVGLDCGRDITSGIKNTLYGFKAGYHLVSGNRNILIGSEAGSQYTGSDRLYIDVSATSYPLIHGKFDDKEVEFGNRNDRFFFNFRESGNTSIIENPSSGGDIYLKTISNGVLKYGEYKSVSSPTIVGSIPFKTNDGVTRKLAVIQ